MRLFLVIRTLRRWSPCLLALAALTCLGCGKGQGTVKGKVQLGDKPIVMGQVTFVVQDYQPQHGRINADGSYEVTGVPVGTAKVMVSSPKTVTVKFDRAKMMQKDKFSEEERKKMKEQMEEMQKSGDPRDKTPDNWVEIPKKYRDPDKTPLTFEVKRGDNEYSIRMEP
jgi:hypothetical protein